MTGIHLVKDRIVSVLPVKPIMAFNGVCSTYHPVMIAFYIPNKSLHTRIHLGMKTGSQVIFFDGNSKMSRKLFPELIGSNSTPSEFLKVLTAIPANFTFRYS